MNLQNEDVIKEQETHSAKHHRKFGEARNALGKGVEHSPHSVKNLFKYSIHTTSPQKQKMTDNGQMEGQTFRLTASNLIS